MSSRLNQLALAVPGAAIVTTALFWLMVTLIAQGEPAITEQFASLKVDFLRVERDESVQLKDRSLPELPDPLSQPALPTISPFDIQTKGGSGGVPIVAPRVSRTIEPNLSAFAVPDSASAIPLVRIPPLYPERALRLGLEGWVRIKFDIAPTGAVENPVVVDAEPQHIFNSAAKTAIKKWKYKPRVISGQPVRQTDMEVIISFHLGDQPPAS